MDEVVPHRNEVLLVGRVTVAPERRALPSGDEVVTWRIVVERDPATRRRGATRAATLDALECTGWSGAVRRAVAGWQPGDVVEITGALRRRFWRNAAGAASRYEVEALRVRRLERAVSRARATSAPSRSPASG